MPFVDYEQYPWNRKCDHVDHDPPKNVSLPPGIYTWECPRCRQHHRIMIQPRSTSISTKSVDWDVVKELHGCTPDFLRLVKSGVEDE